MKHLQIVVVLLLVAAQSATAHPGARPGMIEERELLRAYLDQIEENKELEIDRELSRLEMQQRIYEDYREEWWLDYQEAERQERIQDYWRAYQHGKSLAAELVAKAKGLHYCLFLKTQFENLLPNHENEKLKQARLRGAISAYPECYVDDVSRIWFEELRINIQALRDKIQKYKNDLRFSASASRSDEHQVAEKLNEKAREVLSRLVEKRRDLVERALRIQNEDFANLRNQAERIAARISCSTLRDRYGREVSCTVQRRNRLEEVNFWAAMRVIVEKQELTRYREHADVSQILAAVAIYLRDVRPTDQVLGSLVNNLLKSNREIEARMKRQIANLQSQHAEDLKREVLAIDLCSMSIVASCPTLEERRAIVLEALEIKNRWSDLNRYEAAHNLDLRKLEVLAAAYRAAIAVGELPLFTFKIPSQASAAFQPSDSIGGEIKIPLLLDFESEFYLFGRNQAEAADVYREISL